MEVYFKITKGHPLHGKYIRYKENREVIRKLVDSFFTKQGIEASKYLVTKTDLYLVPTNKDKIHFKNILCKPYKNGLQKVKLNTSLHKAWLSSLGDTKVLAKPVVHKDFDLPIGTFTERLFELDGTVYGSFQVDIPKLTLPEGFIELKASEFFKIIEAYKSRARKTRKLAKQSQPSPPKNSPAYRKIAQPTEK